AGDDHAAAHRAPHENVVVHFLERDLGSAAARCQLEVDISQRGAEPGRLEGQAESQPLGAYLMDFYLHFRHRTALGQLANPVHYLAPARCQGERRRGWWRLGTAARPEAAIRPR